MIRKAKCDVYIFLSFFFNKLNNVGMKEAKEKKKEKVDLNLDQFIDKEVFREK
jgi:hypothetical protein